MSDSTALLFVLYQLDAYRCPLVDALAEEDSLKKAELMISNSLAIGVPDVIGPNDIINANVKLNTLFLSLIFINDHGLDALTQEEFEAATIDDDDMEGSNEERAFRFWINSMGLEDVFVNNLYEDVKDGVLLCDVIDKMNKSVINWKKINKKPRSDFDRNINNNAAITGCKEMGLKMIGLGG